MYISKKKGKRPKNLRRINIYNIGIFLPIKGRLEGKNTRKIRPRARPLINLIIPIRNVVAIHR